MLPPGATEDAFTTVCRDEAALRPGVDRLCQRLGVDVPGLTRFAAGSRPVYASGDLVLKLFPPVDLAGCRVEAGLPEPWTSQLDAFLDEVPLPERPPVLLHTEVMSQHLLVSESADGWRLSGLIDFEPAMRGDREYEFAAIGVFVAEGDARFLTRTLTAYGYAREELGPELRRRLLAWAILHRYSHLASWLRRLPYPAEPTFGAIADRWFATG
jgi:hygromycin-B 7''-O-kinase